jgi:mannose-6-phosphate isomerase-like protein (cupin superfamily)
MKGALQDFKRVDATEVPLEPHALMPGVSVQYLLSATTDSSPLTCAIVHLPVGSKPERHIHENSDDMLYVLTGRGKFWISGKGVFSLSPGTFVRVPKGVLHTPMDIEEDLILYNMWFPAVI